MSFFPEGFDPRSDAIGLIGLVQIDAATGTYGFMPEQEGVFTDVTGFRWYGSQLISTGDVEWSRDGTAPAGELVLSYFQDPAAPDLVDELRATGDAATRGRQVRFYVQPISDVAEFYAPIHPPILIATKTAGAFSVDIEGDVTRRLRLSLEGPTALRRAARGLNYTVVDHNRLLGTTGNPSLEFMPNDTRTEEKLFG